MVDLDRPVAVRGGNRAVAKLAVVRSRKDPVDLALPGINFGEASRAALVNEKVPRAVGPPDLRRQRARVRLPPELDGRRLTRTSRLVVGRQRDHDKEAGSGGR